MSRVPRVRGLIYVTDEAPGIRRVARGAGFVYRRPDGRTVREDAELTRIRSLAIPPAWKDVWICPQSNGHLQATGRDARGRKQHRYHPRWTAVRDEAKYSRMLAFAEALPGLRRRSEADLAAPGLPRRKVVAAVVQLLEKTLIRIGNDEYARHNRSFGLTTIEDRHAKIAGPAIRFRFRGKSGKSHDVALTDPRLARIVRRCQELPGSQLFQYLDDGGRVRDITSSDVNNYLRAAMGRTFTAKDFRTWAGSVLAARALEDIGRADRGPSESACRAGRRCGIASPGEHPRGLPQVLRAPRGHRRVPGRLVTTDAPRARLPAPHARARPVRVRICAPGIAAAPPARSWQEGGVRLGTRNQELGIRSWGATIS